MKKDRAIGSFIGLAIGDALGTTAEFKFPGEFAPITGMRGGGVFRMPVGGWTDDTSMAIALAESLIATDGTLKTDDLMNRFINWWDHGAYSHNGKCFDIGTTTRNALHHFKTTGKLDVNDDPFGAGNGSIMRLSPAVIAKHSNMNAAIDLAVMQGVTTHAAAECIRESGNMAAMIYKAINGATRDEIIDVSKFSAFAADMVPSNGYVVNTLFAAQWAIATTDNFRDAVLKAVNLGDDADTVGAVTGQIAGALYGYSSIPIEWRKDLLWHDELYSLAERLYAVGEKDVKTP